MAPEAAPRAAPANGIRKINPISVPQNVPALVVLDRYDRIVQLDQVFLLHSQEFLTDFLGLRLSREDDYD
jgi:hypothetical protein